ncbi:MAG TPA: VWA domain-containing protein [Gammaproteobacteria bacterium]|nr:VWA domain-containing protein [Gammaproteobacteria bacterium]
MSNFIMQLYWREYLWLFLPVFPLFILFWEKFRQKKSLLQYADTHLLPWLVLPDTQKKSHWHDINRLLIWLLFAIAAAGPRIPDSVSDELLFPPGEAIIVIDHSRSMQANDLNPDRQKIADNMVIQWTQQKNNTKMGLVIFSGHSHVLFPATLDKDALYDTARLLGQIQLPTHGSALTESLLQAKNLFKGNSGVRSIVLLSDGDIPDRDFIRLNKVIAELQYKNISLRILGVGLPVPVPLSDTAGHWLKNNNTAVLTRLNEKKLKTLSNRNNVFYERLDQNTHKLFSNVWQPELTRIKKKNQHYANWNELFIWPLLTALLLIILKNLNIYRWQILTPLLFFSINIIYILQPDTAYAGIESDRSETLHRAYEAWKKQQYTQSRELYTQLEGYIARMGEGASCFREQQIECAIRAFSRAAWQASNDIERGQAAFNLANSFFRQGDFKSAINLYKDALRYQPHQRSYENNLKFTVEVQKNIEEHLRLLARRNSPRQSGAGEIESSINTDNERVSSPLVISADKSEKQTFIVPEKTSLTPQQLALYIQRNQNFITLSTSSEGILKKQHDWSRFSNTSPEVANKAEFWQRLFELEEDIPAHPETPRRLKGVLPW